LICVVVDKRDGELTLSMNGHAGFAKLGDDIVCAAASMLGQALLYALEGVENIRLDSVVRSGHMWLRVTDTKQTRAMLSVAEAGLKQLAAEYPKCVEYTE